VPATVALEAEDYERVIGYLLVTYAPSMTATVPKGWDLDAWNVTWETRQAVSPDLIITAVAV